MLSSKGSQFTYNSQNLKGSGSDLPTAAKSFQYQLSPTNVNISKSIRSPKRLGNQLKDLRQSIDFIVDEVKEKRNVANRAVQRVQQTNSCLINSFDRSMMNSPRHAQSIVLQSVHKENYHLKKQLSNEVMSNNELRRELKMLKKENVELKVRSPMKESSMGYLHEELRELKRENEKLRRKTIDLLKVKTGF